MRHLDMCYPSPGDSICKTTVGTLVIFDWYDGPSNGLLKCRECANEYYFSTIDWSSDHSVRVFGLSPITAGSIEKTIAAFGNEFEGPVWFPKILRTPREVDRPIIDGVIDAIVSTREITQLAISWSVPLMTAIHARRVPEELAQMAYDILVSDEGVANYDWMSFVGESRERGS